MHVPTSIFSSLGMSSNFFRLEGLLAITLIFSSLHRFSIGFKSGLWLGHWKTWMFLSANHFFTTFAVCFGSSLCWNVHWCPRPSFSADCLMLRILMYCSLFMVLFTVIRFPGPLAEKQVFRNGLIAIFCLVSSHNVQLQVLSELLCLSHAWPQTSSRAAVFPPVELIKTAAPNQSG